MTTSPEGGQIPEVTLGWRLRMARELTGMGLREFAEHIGVAPDTLTSAEKDRRKVRPITINAYALATGVDRDWLETGIVPAGPPEPPEGTPAPASDGSALAQLTARKVSRSAGSRTRRYVPPAAA